MAQFSPSQTRTRRLHSPRTGCTSTGTTPSFPRTASTRRPTRGCCRALRIAATALPKPPARRGHTIEATRRLPRPCDPGRGRGRSSPTAGRSWPSSTAGGVQPGAEHSQQTGPSRVWRCRVPQVVRRPSTRATPNGWNTTRHSTHCITICSSKQTAFLQEGPWG